MKIKFTDEKPNKDKVYYLASPFTSKYPIEEHIRYSSILEVGHLLNLEGYVLIEPINQSYQKFITYKTPGDFKYWERHSKMLLKVSSGVIVAKIPGWSTSRGVKMEIEYAKELNYPIYYLEVK